MSVPAIPVQPFLLASGRDDDTSHESDCATTQSHRRHLRSMILPSTNATMVHSKEEPTASKPASLPGIVLSPNAYRITAGLTEQNRLGSTFVRRMLIVLTSWSKLNAGRISDFGALFGFLTNSAGRWGFFTRSSK